MQCACLYECAFSPVPIAVTPQYSEPPNFTREVSMMAVTVEQTTADTTTAQAKSHRGRRQSRSKKSDPFLDLSDDALKLPEQPSPSSRDQNGPANVESLLADVSLASFGRSPAVLMLV